MTLLYVPAGEFKMGANGGWIEESPVHTVYLDAFWIDKTEVTVRMYYLCVQAGVCPEPAEKTSSARSSYYGNADFDNYPVIKVRWSWAQTYCEWAGRRLPTEAEWEKAARGTDRRNYPWGSDAPNNNLLNYNNEVGDTTEVGKYPDGASPYGVLDMAGNVSEWVADWYSETYYAISSDANPLGPSSGQRRVLRGGAWNTETDFFVRAAFRNWGDTILWSEDIGFRCVVNTTP